eukprot:1156718-Pelagomonas_calceolata.AAC.2
MPFKAKPSWSRSPTCSFFIQSFMGQGNSYRFLCKRQAQQGGKSGRQSKLYLQKRKLCNKPVGREHESREGH